MPMRALQVRDERVMKSGTLDNLDGVRDILRQDHRDAKRAADVISRARNLVKKFRPSRSFRDYGEAIGGKTSPNSRRASG